MTEDLRFRPLRVDDLTQVFAPPERELGLEWLARQNEGELYVVVAEVSGVPVGRRCLNFTWQSDEGAVYCFAFNVLPHWRSRGIGTLIDRHSETVARGRGFKALQCAVARTNDRGLAWHERLGYRKIDQRVVRWQDRDGEHELDAWIIERRWRRHSALLARFSPAAGSPTARALFDRAMESWNKGEQGQAVLDFEELVQTFPSDPLAASAQFRIGEAYYTARDFERAAVEYRKAIELAPKGKDTPRALLRLGLAYRAQKREADARQAWSQLVSDFPESDATEEARRALRGR